MKLSALNPFRFRALLPGVLAVGLLLGIWLGDLFKGFGWGPGQGESSSSGNSSEQTAGNSSDEEADLVGVHATDPPEKSSPQIEMASASQPSGGLVHVLIDGRNYYVVRGKKKESIGLKPLVKLIQQTEPNDDGVRAIIDLTRDSRPTAEENLKKSLLEAGLTEAVYWPGRAVE